ncbi:MAG: nitric oxide reductase F protein [Gemmobacter sp.]
MTRDPILRAWGWLILFSLCSTGLAVLPDTALGALGVTVAGAVILGLGWAKARIILGTYLGLDAAPFWRRGFGIVLALYALALLGLYVAG